MREHFDGMYLSHDAAKGVIETYGMERVSMVLSNTVQLQDWDGRYSRRNKEWAKTIPNDMMGYITVRTTTVSEFVAAMKKLHLPEQIIIPMSVIFRFFPTVVEEYNAIGDAMKMRGIRFGGGKASAMLEYRLVPVIMCSVKIGEELNAAALTRGLGGPVKRTNICEIGFHVQDVFFLLLCVVAFAIPIVTMITGR